MQDNAASDYFLQFHIGLIIQLNHCVCLEKFWTTNLFYCNTKPYLYAQLKDYSTATPQLQLTGHVTMFTTVDANKFKNG
jgi:hypothetical protein